MMRMIRTLGIISLLVLLLGANNLAPVLADSNVSVSITTPDEVEANSSFTVTVDITEVTDLNAVQYDIWFNPSVLQLEEVAHGQIGSETIIAMTNEIEPGHWTIVQYPVIMTDAISGSGQLAALHFQHIGSPGDSSDLNITSGILSGMSGEIPSTWTKSTIQVIPEESDDSTPPVKPPAPTEPNAPADSTESSQSSESAAMLPSSPSSQSAKTEPEIDSFDNIEESSPGLSQTPTIGLENTAEIEPDIQAMDPELARNTPLSSTTQSEPINWTLVWQIIVAVCAVVITITVLFLIFRSRRKPY